MWFIWVPEYISRYLDFNSAPLFSDVQNGRIIGDIDILPSLIGGDSYRLTR